MLCYGFVNGYAAFDSNKKRACICRLVFYAVAAARHYKAINTRSFKVTPASAATKSHFALRMQKVFPLASG